MFIPKISFVIPTLNRERTLENCLKSISNQNYTNKEIIIVDGGSKDKTLVIASKYASKIISDKGSLGKARAIGVAQSTGEILGIFDSDIILPDKDWTTNAIKEFSHGRNIGIVWPFNKAPENSSIISRCYFLIWRSNVNRILKNKSNVSVVPGGNSLFLRKAVETAGGFNTSLHFGEDLDLSIRIMRLGYGVVVFKNPIIHDTMWSLKEYTRKQIWGASSLAKADTSVLDLCLNWSERKNNQKRSIGKSAFFLILNSLDDMAKGLREDRSWSVLPILLSIRMIIYGRYLSSRLLKQ